jgi:hypothetical protein
MRRESRIFIGVWPFDFLSGSESSSGRSLMYCGKSENFLQRKFLDRGISLPAFAKASAWQATDSADEVRVWIGSFLTNRRSL